MAEIAIDAFFSNVEKNFAPIPKVNGLNIPDQLLSGCRCTICVVKIPNDIPVGGSVSGSWIDDLIFNGIDANKFYFMTTKGEWLDFGIDEIVDIIVLDDDDEELQVIHNDMWQDGDDFDYEDEESDEDDQ